MAESSLWRRSQLAVLQALEVPVHVRRKIAADARQPAAANAAALHGAPEGVETSSSAATATGHASWRLRASPELLAAVQRQRWYAQLCRYRPPSAEALADGTVAVILLDGEALPLEGDPPRPSGRVKRVLYQALRSAANPD